MSNNSGSSGIGLSIKVRLDDTEAKTSLNQLLKEQSIHLNFDSRSLTQIETQLSELSKLSFDKILNQSTLTQFETMSTQLKSQLESVQAMKQAFAEMKIPKGFSEMSKVEKDVFKEASDLQKEIQKETEKIRKSTGEEAKQRRSNLKLLKEHLNTLTSQIRNQELLNRLESQAKKLRADSLNKKLDEKQAQREIEDLKKKAKELKKAQDLQVDGYQMIEKINNQIYQQTKKMSSATREEQRAIQHYINSLKTLKQDIRGILIDEGLLNSRKETRTEFNEILRLGNLQLNQVHQEATAREKLNRATSKNTELSRQERKEAKYLIEMAQKEYEIKLKSLQVGRNGKYVDQYDLAGFQQKLNSLKPTTSLKELRKELRQLGLAFRELSVDANAARINQTGGALTALNKTFQNLAKYVSGALIIRQFFSEMRQGIQDVKELDSAMVTLRMTMSEFSERDIARLVNKSIELSKTLKTNVSDVLEAVKTVANASESMESIMNKSKAALIISNLSGIDVGSSVNMIQSATRQFDDLKDASEASTMAVADSMIAISKSLGMDFAEGIQGMSEGLSILGSVANQFGMDLNETLSMLAATSETTRSSFSETATALKTIMARTMRIGSLDENVSLDDMLKTEKALARIGVNIRNLETNEMRNFRDIIQDVYNKFDKLDEATQSYIADAMGKITAPLYGNI